MDEQRGGPFLAERLDKAVRVVCPIHGVSIGRRVDEAGAWARDTWRVNPKAEATLEEIRAAFDVLAKFDPDYAPAPEPEAPLLPAPDALMSDYGPVGAGYDDVTGDMLLDAFEQDEAEAVAVIQVLSATRQRHISEQLNVDKARYRREHMLTDQANPREASIDRLLGLLTRRGD